MKQIYIIVLLLFSICITSFGYEIEEGNHTEITDREIQELVDNSILAIKTRDKKVLSTLFHSRCNSLSSQQQKDYDLFLKYLFNHSIEDNFKWKAIPFKSYEGYIFKINRFPIHPEINIDLFKKYPEKRNGKNYWSLSLWATLEDGRLKLVYYMNDYMVKEINEQS